MTKIRFSEARELEYVRFEQLASRARASAKCEPLSNVRAIHLKSAASWDALAASGRKIDVSRERDRLEWAVSEVR